MHSDQGIVYQSQKLQNYLKNKNFIVSMSRKSTPNNNDVIESFFGNLKNWLKIKYNDLYFDNHKQIKMKIYEFVKFCNEKWIFEKFNFQTPIEYRNSYIK
ncbi:hypothetical protein [Candidatus Phytoplasma sp. AldY-WA1]|uniref:hypothetical protein n=1 Tax=Candidatus Phytoplasma sp. AldY-WA1 TaxID=2852100 RepID=UPI00254C96B4|nr:hypothetical protein [Candidatus Phytoplasma sp. AldY-WA1]